MFHCMSCVHIELQAGIHSQEMRLLQAGDASQEMFLLQARDASQGMFALQAGKQAMPHM